MIFSAGGVRSDRSAGLDLDDGILEASLFSSVNLMETTLPPTVFRSSPTNNVALSIFVHVERWLSLLADFERSFPCRQDIRSVVAPGALHWPLPQ